MRSFSTDISQEQAGASPAARAGTVGLVVSPFRGDLGEVQLLAAGVDGRQPLDIAAPDPPPHRHAIVLPGAGPDGAASGESAAAVEGARPWMGRSAMGGPCPASTRLVDVAPRA